MRLSELRKMVKEVMRETVIDKDGLERVASSLPQTKEKKTEEKIKGGKAGGLGLTAIAEKHGVSVDSLVKEFKMGIGVEMEHTDDREVAKEITLDHLYEDPKYYSKLKSIHTEGKLNEFTKGQIFGGKLKIGGESVEVEVELLGADNKKKVFVTKIIGVDKKWWSKLPKDGILQIPARIFRTPGGGWYKVKTPKVFESKGCGCGCNGKSKSCSI